MPVKTEICQLHLLFTCSSGLTVADNVDILKDTLNILKQGFYGRPGHRSALLRMKEVEL
jgi:hypothetical protein